MLGNESHLITAQLKSVLDSSTGLCKVHFLPIATVRADRSIEANMPPTVKAHAC